jgi:flavin reductase (DIM6/NTAB) family NADH-FMN oxidoreductase RutF
MQAIDLAKSYRLLNHGPTVLVTAAHGGHRNVMAAAWCMPLDFQPAKVAVVVDRNTFTRGLIDASACFGLSVPRASMLAAVMKAGSLGGRELADQGLDKFDACGLQAVHPLSSSAAADSHGASERATPLVAGCLAWLLCRLLPEPEMAMRHDLFLAEVTAAWADPAAFSDGRWHLAADEGQRSIHHVAGGAFFVTGASIQSS